MANPKQPNPRHLILELTDRCNLKCMICVREEYEEHIGGPGSMMAVEDILKLESPIRDASEISITGFGETFLHPDLKRILDSIYELNPSDNLIRMVTNGTALGADKAAWFAGHLNTLSISLNSSNPEAYAREMHPYEMAAGRDVSGKFQRLVDKIIAFADQLTPQDRRKVHLHFVVHRENMRDMAAFVELAHKMELSQVMFTHFKIHREKDIGSSIYWAKDDYNDAFDDAVEVGRRLGVTVGGRKFFTESQRPFVAERDCTWPIDSALIGVKGDVVPCCYWSGGDRAGNAFASHQAFDEIWSGEFYRKLRAKRDAVPCSTCNILHTFDDVTLHFSPFLKSAPSFTGKMAHYREITAKDLQQINKGFETSGLDMGFHRRAVRRTTQNTAALLEVDVNSNNPLLAIDQAIWDRFLTVEPSAQRNVVVDLTGQFLGTGWGPDERNQHAQAWRWLGAHDGPATIFLNLEEGRSYRIEMRIHSAASAESLNSIAMSANGFDAGRSSVYMRKGNTFFSCVIPREAAESNEGRVRLSIRYVNPGRNPRELSVASLKVEATQEPVGIADLAKRQAFANLGLDVDLHEYALLSTAGATSGLIRPGLASADPVEAIENTVSQSFKAQRAKHNSDAEIDLAANFIGTGWGVSGANSNNQSWRWLGRHGGRSSIFLHLKAGAAYWAEFELYTTSSMDAVKALTATANGVPVSCALSSEGSRHVIRVEIPTERTRSGKGRVRLSLAPGQEYSNETMAFSSLKLIPIENARTAWRSPASFTERLRLFVARGGLASSQSDATH